MSRVWFTSDTHFYHRNVIEYCNRPFGSVEEMHAGLIRNWNELVRIEDIVYILGDYCFGGAGKIAGINAQLNGHKILVRGNHDDKRVLRSRDLGFYDVIDSVAEGYRISLPIDDLDGTFEPYLSHYPYRGTGDTTEQERFSGKRIVDDGESILLHGHVHQHWKTKGRMINVGVDVWDYRPIPLEQILVEVSRIIEKPRE